MKIDMTPTWAEAVRMWFFALSNCASDRRPEVIKQAKIEFTRLAEAYTEAVEKVQQLTDDLESARSEYKGIRDALDELPLHETDSVRNSFEYHEPNDVAMIMQIMNRQVREWDGASES